MSYRTAILGVHVSRSSRKNFANNKTSSLVHLLPTLVFCVNNRYISLENVERDNVEIEM